MTREERGERILAAAEELLLSWSYRRVTIDEVARRAHVGKGTVYLHWRTKDGLFLAVLLRMRLRSLERQLSRMGADSLEVLPGRLLERHFLDFVAEPAQRALYSHDSEALGRLSGTARKELAGLLARSDETLLRHFGVLREHGLVKDDAAPEGQLYAFKALAAGFFLSESLLSPVPGTAEERAALLARTVRDAFETPVSGRDAAPGAVRAGADAAAPAVIGLYRTLEELIRRELDRQLRD